MAKSNDQKVLSTLWSAGCGSHGGCGCEIFVKNGKVTKVEGDCNHPWNQGRLCAKGLAIREYIYHPDRVLYPLKRVGKRGEGKWERITWDEAYDTIEKKLKDIREKHGAESVIFCQGTGRDIGGPITFLMYAYGSPNWVQVGLAGHACYTPRLGAMFATHGNYTVADCSQFLEKRYNSKEWTPPKYIIIWAQNPAAGCHDGFYGHWIIDCMKRGSKLITIDPRSTWFSTRSEVHLQNRPGTDGAIALGMLNVIINEGIYDKKFVEKWCYGFSELKKRVQEYSPEKVEKISGVPANLLRKAARLYAKNKPSAIQWGEPVDAMPAGSVVAQAITQLWSITGNIDVPGGNVIAKNSHGVTTYPFSSAELTDLYGADLVKRLNEKRIGANDYPMIKNFRGWVQPDVLIKQMETGKPYPVKAAWIQTSNILGGQAADPKRHYEAMKKLDFIVAVDLFQNPTTMALADIFLPAATIAEKESFRTWWQPLGVSVKAIKGLGAVKSDWEINLEMAKRLSTTPIKYKNVREVIDERLSAGKTNFEKLKAKGCWEFPPKNDPSRPYYRYERGLLRKDGKPGFDTPTGKVELYATKYKEWGLDPLPYYEEPKESPVATKNLAKEYPLILTTGRRSPVFFHSEHRMIPWLRELDPVPVAEINDEVAESLGIKNGDWVYVENTHGKIKMKAKASPICPPEVVSVPHGWWLPETDGTAPNLFSTWDHNVNNLTSMGNQGKSGFGGTNYRSGLCRVYKVEGGKE
ncbi:MAG: molybdopterin-dependent oxidoreductase [Dehalococcoidales bacterium]|nr:molybdopterin-dependent oxidoreductase [Dehalococcoidales bacterium]